MFLLEYYTKARGELCNNESDVIRSESDCKAALASLFRGLENNAFIKSEDNIPAGCSVATLKPYFSTASGLGHPRNDLTPICKETCK